MYGDILYRFETANLVVTCYATPEDTDPADNFQFQDDIDAVRNGDVAWFCAVVTVTDKTGRELGRDVLGGCAYRDGDEFVSGPYFHDMVRNALGEARTTLEQFHMIRLRHTADGERG